MLGEVVMKKVYDNIYDKYITYDNVLSVWNTVRKTCKNKRAIYRFSVNCASNIYAICSVLKNRRYKPYQYRLFLIFEPKPRLVMSQSIQDKIVNHFVAKYYLLPYLEPKLIDSNVATRNNKGSSYADCLLKKYINSIRMQNSNKEIYCLKMDISKYFYNIDHNILLNMLEEDIKDRDVLNLIKAILKETNKPYVNEKIINLNNKYQTEIPLYKKDVGLSIGAMTSQFLAIYYLNDLDHYIKEVLKCNYYIRYMDDFLILDVNKDKLKRIKLILSNMIEKLNLQVNPKSNIYSLNQGFSFIGYQYKTENNKFIVKLRNKTLKKIRKRLKILYDKDRLKYYRSLGSYYGYLKKVIDEDVVFVMKTKEKYDYYKSTYSKSIVLIKEGSFYKTYLEDAVIVWDIFNYKWFKDSIAFGISNANKVFDELKRIGIGYVVINEDIAFIGGNDEVYDLYKRLSEINFDKYEKKRELSSILDGILDRDISKYTVIKNFLMTI